MPYELKLPDVGEGVAEGEILRWLVREGQVVKEDQPLVEVMTDKVNVEIPAPRAGTILKLLAKEGETVKVGNTLLIIGEPSETVGASAAPIPAKAAARPAPTVTPAPALPSAAPPTAPGRVLATPATRRLARELGVDLTQIPGSGSGGRITDDDVRRAAQRKPAVAVTEVRPAPLAALEERIPFRGIRKRIAERLVQSLRTTAQVTHVDEVDVTELVAFRERAKPVAEAKGLRLTYLPFVMKAVVAALQEFPLLNAAVDEARQEIVVKKYCHLGVATATAEALIVPVVRDVDRKSVLQLAAEVEAVAERARQGALSLEEVHGGTFTITNIGPIGGMFATPIINPPEVAILGLHTIQKRPVVRADQVVVRDMTYVSISFDHRVVDGAYVARFTNALKRYLEDPKLLFLDAL